MVKEEYPSHYGNLKEAASTLNTEVGEGFSVVNLDKKTIFDLFKKAQKSSKARFSFVLHKDPQEVEHRILNCMLPDTYPRPHRHDGEGRYETFFPLFGEAAALVFEDDGRIRKAIPMGGRFGKKIVQIEPGIYHTVIVLTPFLMLELKVHPVGYTKESDKVFAPWAPEEGSRKAREYLEKLKAEIILLSA
jgi:cupin fold WbuC family metalloprotein